MKTHGVYFLFFNFTNDILSFLYCSHQCSRTWNRRCQNPSWETSPVGKNFDLYLVFQITKKKISNRNLSSFGEMLLKYTNVKDSPDLYGRGRKDKRWTKPGLRELTLFGLCYGRTIWSLESFWSCYATDAYSV